MKISSHLLLLFVLGMPATAVMADTLSSPDDYPERPWRVTEQRAPCDHYKQQRQVFWGDLHVHTALSLDALTWDTRTMPADAYRYAQGGQMGFPPYDAEGKPARYARLGRALDFAMVSDHAEHIGLVEICSNPEREGYDTLRCRLLRENLPATFVVSMAIPIITSELGERVSWLGKLFKLLGIGSSPSACGENNRNCFAAGKFPWEQTQAAAEAAYDRSSACAFTSFIGYEWTGYDAGNIHRNILFRNHIVTEYPYSSVEFPDIISLWQQLELHCVNAGNGCEVIGIPHNSNVSAGKMFPNSWSPQAYNRGEAVLNARFEKLVEIFQHKGDSECFYGPGTVDELCAFEKLPYHTLGSRINPAIAKPAEPHYGFVRSVLSDGLLYRQRYGVNPYQLGILASTDSHLSSPGQVDDRDYRGHTDTRTTLSKVLKVDTALPDATEFNPGGLTGIWAEENTRDSLYSALERKEVFGTSGPRIPVRFFSGWNYDKSLCNSRDRVAAGYSGGVAMGSEMKDIPEGVASPHFAVWASRDPEGTPLERIQIIKGWVDGEGKPREKVYTVATSKTPGATVDLLSCTPKGEGADNLCAVWQDPQFEPGQQAWYYARVVQNPTCRWTTFYCNRLGVNCDNPSTYEGNLAPCCDAQFPKTSRERAWSSPIWYYPPATETAGR